MKLKFDSTQEYQIQAVASFVDLFEGQALMPDDYSVIINTQATQGQSSMEQTVLGFGNKLSLNPETLYQNLCAVQIRNNIELVTQADFEQNGLNFSVEMETGTGKTYVYLRTIFALNQQYGFKKFIIVVPSVAIREGTLKNLAITQEHFRDLYNNIAFEYFVYDSKAANRLRNFAESNQLQIMVINIDAFRKDFSDSEDSSRKSNVIFKENDKLSGRRPIDFVQAVNPIVIIDEPQSVDNTPRAQEAMRALNPLCMFRFSATHKNVYNLLYRLDPVNAYQMRLVKQIVVASVTGENAHNNAYLKLLATDNKIGIKARLKIHQQNKTGVKETEVWVKQGDDLYELSKERAVYQHNYEVLDINTEPNNEYIDFNWGRLHLGEERGGITDDLISVQIRNTIKKHLDKELQLFGRGIKVLSLFFVDKVANYRIYTPEGKAAKGKFAELFEEHYNNLIQMPQYQKLATFKVEKLHEGYFSADKKGILKDTNGNTQADDDTYAKIMRNKEQLLSMDEPLKFIFSHSALREGWDNPNVFQICLLREVGTGRERRQTIGRGLRLPVNSNGERVKDDNINKLTVIARETYAEFAAGLQKEYEEDAGIVFGKVPQNAFATLASQVLAKDPKSAALVSKDIWDELKKGNILDDKGKIKNTFTPHKEGFELPISEKYKEQENNIIEVIESYQLEQYVKKDKEPKYLSLNKQVYLSPEFAELWEKIKHRTTYRVNYSTDDLIVRATTAVMNMDKMEPAKVFYREDAVDINYKGITTEQTKSSAEKIAFKGTLPDILTYLQKHTELTRNTLAQILAQSNRLGDFAINPQKFMDTVVALIQTQLHRLMIDGITYEKLTIGETEWEMQRLADEELKAYFQESIAVNRALYNEVIYDSNGEKQFAETLDQRKDDIMMFVKLPKFFTIETPIGTYNPDWAMVKYNDQNVYLVKETKGTKNYEKLRPAEVDKIKCGKKHFEALGVDFNIAVTSKDV